MHFNHKLINDLSWSIGSPSLLDSEKTQHPAILDSTWGKDQLNSALQILDHMDRNPHKIQSFLSESEYFRLGHYFENLVAYWFMVHPDYEILEKNKIIQCSEENRTLGEIDFILNHLTTGEIIHMEVAVKFYLQVEHNDRHFWFGTNLKDRLDIKLHRLIHHQIVMSDRLEQYAINKKQVLLKGRLFKYSPTLSSEYCWLTISDFLRLQEQQSRWIILHKPFWLAKLSEPESHFLESCFLSKQQLIVQLENIDSHPVCVAQIDCMCETRRFFITGNEWKNKAIETLL